jgi:type IV pilus assembly protein PilX
MKSNLITRRKYARSSRGVALIVSLILLVVMTMLGLAAVRTITQEERMASQTFDRSIAFQATEAGLREVEALVETLKPTPAAGTGCNAVDGLMRCSTPAVTDTPRWEDAGFTSWQAATTVGTGTLSVTPQYFVEYLGQTFACVPGSASDPMNCKRYRITARTQGGAGRSTVMLQSVYATD